MGGRKRVRNSNRSKKKARSKRQQPPGIFNGGVIGGDDDGEEQVLSSDDAEFIDEELKTGRMGFLSSGFNFDATSGKKKKRRVQDEEGEGLDDLPRLWDNEDPNDDQDGGSDLHYLLPLKDKNKLIHQDPVKLPEVVKISSETVSDEEDQLKGSDNELEGSGSELEGSDDGGLEGSGKGSRELSAVQLMLLREKRLQIKKTKIAELSSQIMENPQTNVHLLGKLKRMCSEKNIEVSSTVKKLSMVSLLTIYKDIVPGYSIRELTDIEKSVKVSKDVRQLRSFEQTLLTNYKQYIALLVTTVQEDIDSYKREKLSTERMEADDTTTSKPKSVGDVALHCLCELASSLGHFNYHGDVFSALVNWMATPPTKVYKTCCETISSIFKNDSVGNSSLEIVQLMTKMIKGRSYNVPNEVIRTFLSLQLRNVEEPVNQMGVASTYSKANKDEKLKRKTENKKLTRKQRRRSTMRNRLEREMKEMEIEERQEKKSKLQTECIKMVFFIYFRILKHSPDSALLSDVLEGLAKYSHLISIDYFSDLMTVLQDIMKKQNLSPRNTLRCIYTCFEILSDQGESLNIDPHTFYCQLYTNILHLDHYSTHSDVMLMLQCLEKMIKRRRQVSVQRICSFIKRLATIDLQLPSGVALGVMATIRLFMQAYPHHSSGLLEHDDTPQGIFQPEIPDPELSGAQSSLLWELSTLTHHYDPHVSSYAQHLIKGAPSHGPGSLSSSYSRRPPTQLMKDHSWPDLDPLVGVAPVKKIKLAIPTTPSPYCTTEYMRTRIERADNLIAELLA